MPMEATLFARLWEEIDFDDHPHSGGHGCQPEGELIVTEGDGWIRLADDRLSLSLGLETEADSIHRWTQTSVQMNDGPERMGVHRWSLSPSSMTDELAAWVKTRIGEPEEISGASVERERALLTGIRKRLEPLLPGWTWHLEVDNKADRMGWYVRAPSAWCSLFTIFVGMSRLDDNPGGFLLFERAPPGELDRPDEDEANRLDGLRTVALCNGSRGALSILAGDMHWATSPAAYPLPSLPGVVHLWPPSMGRWPLLHARTSSQVEIAEWAHEIVTALQPAISTLSAQIDCLSWH